MQFEEREHIVRSAFAPDVLYEWNIDGLSEYEILNHFQEMIMVANVYKGSRKSDHQMAHIIVTGFTGQLKGWWDHYLPDEQKTQILTAYKHDENMQVIKTENGLPLEDAVNTLIYVYLFILFILSCIWSVIPPASIALMHMAGYTTYC